VSSHSLQVAVLDDYQQVAVAMAPWATLPADVSVTAFQDHVSRESELVERLQGFDVIVLMRERTPMPASVLWALPDLRLLVTTGLANAAIDLEAARQREITVCGTAGDLTGTVELTWGLIIALSRHIVREDTAIRRGSWQETVGRTLAGSTLGLLGLGRIGQRVARIAQAFDIRVTAWSENLTAEIAERYGVTYVDRDDLFRMADVVSLHLQLSPRTRGIVGARELGLMKPSAYIINTSRGPLIDERALLRALGDDTIAGAGLDVHWEEPLPLDHPLLKAANTVLTPHIGYVTDTNYGLYFPDVVDDIAAFLRGQPVRVLIAAS